LKFYVKYLSDLYLLGLIDLIATNLRNKDTYTQPPPPFLQHVTDSQDAVGGTFSVQ
jgi:hypothetical protein